MNQISGLFQRSFFLTLLRRKIAALAALFLLLAGASTISGQEVIDPSKNIEATGVPPIPASLAREVQPYRAIWIPLRMGYFEREFVEGSSVHLVLVLKPWSKPETSSITFERRILKSYTAARKY